MWTLRFRILVVKAAKFVRIDGWRLRYPVGTSSSSIENPAKSHTHMDGRDCNYAATTETGNPRDIRKIAVRARQCMFFNPELLENWSEREDLNLRPLVPQTSALTRLRYAPTVRAYRRCIMVWQRARHANFRPEAVIGQRRQSGLTERCDRPAAIQEFGQGGL